MAVTNYSSWKVNDLKAELKRRGIPQTGLRLKQNFIDRLVEDDSNQQLEETRKEVPSKTGTAESDDKAEHSQHVQEKASDGLLQLEESKPSSDVAKIEGQKCELARDVAAQAQNEFKASERKEEQPVKENSPPKPQEEHTEDMKDQGPQPAIRESIQTDEPHQMGHKVPTEIDSGMEGPIEPAAQLQEDTAIKTPTLADSESANLTAPAEAAMLHAPNMPEADGEPPTTVSADGAVEDSRKRKRCSQSPALTPETVANKKSRDRSGTPQVSQPGDVCMDVAPQETEIAGEPREIRKKDGISEDLRDRRGVFPKQNARFKDLFTPAGQEPVQPASPPRGLAAEGIEVDPAQHGATAALYVDGLMRPLQPAALKNHLISLALAPGASSNHDTVVDFYLDHIKTHCFVSFTSISAASRVRAALHGTVWPNERNRKCLFVDFIPEHKMREWIDIEDSSRGRDGPTPRWVVKYILSGDSTEAVLEEVSGRSARAVASQALPREPATTRAPPLRPRADIPKNDRRSSGSRAVDARPQPGHGFQPLDALFQSTKTKPKLYYQPVPREIADRRLDRFDDLIRKGLYPRRGGNDMRRITFEEGDFFVDQGGEFGNRGGRGGRGRGRGLGRDGWRG